MNDHIGCVLVRSILTLSVQSGLSYNNYHPCNYIKSYGGDSYENAMAESIIGLFETEVIWPRGPWKNVDAVEYATLEWVNWYKKNKRLLEPIGNIPPVEFESAYYEQENGQAMAA